MRKLLVILICFIFIFQACEKELITNDIASIDTKYWVSDGILCFNNSDDYHDLLDSIRLQRI